jgi:hypothetical protein
MASVLKNIINERHEFVFKVEVVRAVHLPITLIGTGTQLVLKRHKKVVSTQVNIVDEFRCSNWNESLMLVMTMFKQRKGKSWDDKTFHLKIERMGSEECLFKTSLDFSHFATLDVSQTVCFSLPLSLPSEHDSHASNSLLISGMTFQENCFISSPAMNAGKPSILLKVTRLLKFVDNGVHPQEAVNMDMEQSTCGHRQVEYELEESNRTASRSIVTRTLSPVRDLNIGSQEVQIDLEEDSQQKRILNRMASLSGDKLTHSFSSKRSDTSNTTRTSVKYARPGNRLEDAVFRPSSKMSELSVSRKL